MKLHKLFAAVKDFYTKLLEDEIFALSAQVTYYMILAFFPFLIFLITLISYTQVISIESYSILAGVVPASVYQMIEAVINDVLKTRDTAFLSLGMLATVLSASSGVLAFMHGINKAYHKKETRPFWKVHLISILFTLGLAIVLIFALLLLVFGEVLGRYIFDQLGYLDAFKGFWNMIRYVMALVTMLLVFILLDLYSPNCSVYLRDILPGALLSTAGWVITSSLFAFYVNNFGNFHNMYGGLSTVIVLLLWLYWSSIIVLAGNEVNAYRFMKKKGSADC